RVRSRSPPGTTTRSCRAAHSCSPCSTSRSGRQHRGCRSRGASPSSRSTYTTRVEDARPQLLPAVARLRARGDDGGGARAIGRTGELRQRRLLGGARELVDLRRDDDEREVSPLREELDEVLLLLLEAAADIDEEDDRTEGGPAGEIAFEQVLPRTAFGLRDLR